MQHTRLTLDIITGAESPKPALEEVNEPIPNIETAIHRSPAARARRAEHRVEFRARQDSIDSIISSVASEKTGISPTKKPSAEPVLPSPERPAWAGEGRAPEYVNVLLP
jgi:hypothetical protein